MKRSHNLSRKNKKQKKMQKYAQFQNNFFVYKNSFHGVQFQGCGLFLLLFIPNWNFHFHKILTPNLLN